MFDDGRGEDLKEEILVGLFLDPAAATFFFRFGARADGDQNYAMGFSLLKRVLQPFAVERGAVDANGVAGDFEAVHLAGIDPRTAILCIPVAGPIR